MTLTGTNFSVGSLASNEDEASPEGRPMTSSPIEPQANDSVLKTPTCQTPYTRFHSARKFKIAGYNHTHVESCVLSQCDLNNNHAPVKILSCDVEADQRVTEKVTLIVKTTQRLTETERLIRSLHQNYPSLKVVVVDDNANITTSKNADIELEKQRLWDDFISKSNGLVHYIKLQGDAGISKGRNVALQLVKSKYVLVLDDDVVTMENSNLLKMVDILDRTDLSIVGAELERKMGGLIAFSGIVRAHQQDEPNNAVQLHEYVNTAYEEIPFFPFCFAVDYVLNVFLAKTEDLMTFGGWDENLPVGEHRDFLIGLRKAGYKLAYCTDIVFKHREPNAILNQHTMAIQQRFGMAYYAKKWNILWKNIIQCKRDLYLDYKCR